LRLPEKRIRVFKIGHGFVAQRWNGTWSRQPDLPDEGIASDDQAP
jgi:hypothetical protein